MTDADIRFYFDPVCPFAWMTSKWVRMVAAQRDYTVDWRFISLRLINSGIDYDSHFPAGYEEGHTSGLRLLRVAARARAEHGRTAVGRVLRGRQQRDLRLPRRRQPDARHPRQPRLRRAAARPGGPARRAGGRAGRHAVGRRDPRRGRRGAVADRQGRRHADHPLQPAGRRGVLRPGDQQAPEPGGRRPALGLRDRPGQLPRVRRAQAKPARAPATAQLRRSSPARPGRRRTGTPAAANRRRSLGQATSRRGSHRHPFGIQEHQSERMRGPPATSPRSPTLQGPGSGEHGGVAAALAGTR